MTIKKVSQITKILDIINTLRRWSNWFCKIMLRNSGDSSAWFYWLYDSCWTRNLVVIDGIERKKEEKVKNILTNDKKSLEYILFILTVWACKPQ